MKINKSGFTIVELLIVIVVIGILAAITIVAYNGLQQRSRNTARVSEATQYQKIFGMYKATYGEYPSSGTACLGENYPDTNNDGIGNCWDLHSTGTQVSVNATLNTELKKVSPSLPNNIRTPIVGSSTGTSRLGPAYDSGSKVIVYWLEGAGSCPVGTARWNDLISQACQLNLP
jgi:prepilin-type N-terminal cleavage/methylation domain-containing protein